MKPAIRVEPSPRPAREPRVTTFASGSLVVCLSKQDVELLVAEILRLGRGAESPIETVRRLARAPK